jgi:signal transduction histidine kinase/CheY-like chemotaxis protein
VTRWRIERITARFLALAVSASALMAVVVAAVVASMQFEAERNRQAAAVADIAFLNSIALQEPMWSINERATRAIVGSLSAHPQVLCAEVTGLQGELMASTGEGGCAHSDDTNELVQQIVYENHLLGHLRLWLDQGAISAAAAADVWRTVLLFLLLSLGLVVSAVYALRATVMTPLAHLNDAIRAAAKVPDAVRPQDELGQVIIAYNRLLDRIAAHNAEMDEARAQAVAAAKAKSRFLATMSHEIRTPMHGVLGTVELLMRETALSTQQRQFAEIILHSTQALLDIINDILDLSKIEAGKVRLAPAPTSPEKIMCDVAVALQATARAKGLSLQVMPAADLPPWVMADPLRLRQVVMNLVGNAVKFTEKGAITVSLARRGHQLEIAVADTGIGIAAADMSNLFEAFRQLDASTTRRHGGTGLGLSISRQLVELMGGTLEVESRLGHGSVFRVLLPLVEAAAPAEAQSPPPLVAVGGGCVLAAEDNPVNQWLLRSQLERLGYQVDMHADGRSALAAFTQGKYVAVVTDYHMPIMDGLDLSRAIRRAETEAGQGPRIPLIGMTADAFAETVEECLRAGMDEVVTKPLSLEGLGAVLARRVHGQGEPAAACEPAAAPAAAEEVPLLDSSIAGLVLGDDASAITELFASTADILRADIDRHLAGVNADLLREAAHSFASAAFSLGATRLGMAARALEHAAHDGAWDQIPELAARVAALDGETRQVLAREWGGRR